MDMKQLIIMILELTIFFFTDDNKIKLVDWQVVSVGNYTIDCSKLIGCNLDMKILKENGLELVKSWFNNYKKEIKDLSYDDFLRDLKSAFLFELDHICYVTTLLKTFYEKENEENPKHDSSEIVKNLYLKLFYCIENFK
jgi:hypothetical protein